jgi:hypothetical protein
MTRLIDRIVWAKKSLKRVEPTYCIAWEDPDEPNEPMKVTTPAPEWLAMALYGDLLPPVEVYHAIEDTLDEKGAVNPEAGAQLHDAPRMPAMTEEQALEYLLQKDVPRRVWQQSHNRQLYYIVPRSAIPTDRHFRNAWRLNNE